MIGKIVSPKTLRNSHPDSKKETDYQNFWAYLFLRPASFYIAPVFIYIGLSANQVTLFGGVVLLQSLILIVLADSYTTLLIGAILVNIWLVLDYADGVVARFNSTESVLGEYFDWIVGLLERSFLPISVGIFLYTTSPESTLPIFSDIPPIAWVLLALIEVITRLLRRTIQYKTTILINSNGQYSNSSNTIIFLASAFRSFKRPLLVIFALLQSVDIWLIVYAFYSIGVFIPVIFISTRKIYNSE